LNQTHLLEGELVAYLDGEATPAAQAHVAGCLVCQAAARELEPLRRQLRAALWRGSCPSGEDLMQYVTQDLPRPRRKAIEEHLAGCHACCEDLARLSAILAEDTGPNWIEHLAMLGRQILTAVLLPAAGLPVPALALRGALLREQTYQAGAYQVRLTITAPPRNEGLWQIQGQVTAQGAPVDVGELQLRQEERVVAEDHLDESGYFELQKIRGGRYTLMIEPDQASVLLLDVQLT